MQFIFVIEMIETNAKTRRKIEKRRKNIKMKKKISTENFKLMQKTCDILYVKLIDFSNKFLLKTMRIDFENMC